MVAIAIDVSNETSTGKSEVDAARIAYAVQVLKNPLREARLMAQGVVTNPVIDEESEDADIAFTVSSMWNAYAGINPGLIV